MLSAETLTLKEMAVGKSAEFQVVLTGELVTTFAALSGDYSPLHMDELYAKTTPFGKRVVHGQIAACFFSRLVGMHLPGKNALYVRQTTNFRLPMYIGMDVLVRGTVSHVSEANSVVTIATQVLNQHTGEVLVDGEAMVNIRQ